MPNTQQKTSHAKITTHLNSGNHFQIICYCSFALIWSKCEKLMFSADNIVRYSNKCLSNKLSYSKKNPTIRRLVFVLLQRLFHSKNVCAHRYSVDVDRLMERMWKRNDGVNVNHTAIECGTVFLSFTWLQHTHYCSHKDVVHISR